MNDTLIEILVERKPSVGTKLAKSACLLLTILFACLSPFIGLFMALSAVATGFITYFLGLRSELEYEYSYFDKEIDIDVIYSKQRRKHLITLDLTKLEILAPKSSYKLDEYKNRVNRISDYTSAMPENEKKVYSMIFSDGRRIDIEPTSQLVETIARFAPRKVFRN